MKSKKSSRLKIMSYENNEKHPANSSPVVRK